MGLPRFLVAPEVLRTSPVGLTGAELHHCRVLRLRPGAAVRICDGAGREFAGRLLRVSSSRAEVNLEEEVQAAVESPLDVTLYQALTRSEKMEFILQKTTELGLSRFVPVLTERVQGKRPAGEDGRLARWREIARQAVRQSGRTRLPEVAAPCTFAQAVAAARQAPLALLPTAAAEPEAGWKQLPGVGAGLRAVSILVGPEGGFSTEEVDHARAAGLKTLRLGPRILRTETAGVVVVALAQFTWGDLGGEGAWTNP